MKAKYKIKDLELVIDSDKIEFDESKAIIHKVHEDEEFAFEAISCAARPVQFSIVNQLYSLQPELVKEACDEANKEHKIGVLSTNNYHLLLSPFVERFSFFGQKEASQLTNDVIDICKKLNVASLRITQFCMMRHESMPIFDQFKGILNTFISRKDSPIKSVYFDVPDKFFYELNILFKSYQTQAAV